MTIGRSATRDVGYADGATLAIKREAVAPLRAGDHARDRDHGLYRYVAPVGPVDE